jgi:hypothetical protein
MPQWQVQDWHFSERLCRAYVPNWQPYFAAVNRRPSRNGPTGAAARGKPNAPASLPLLTLNSQLSTCCLSRRSSPGTLWLVRHFSDDKFPDQAVEDQQRHPEFTWRQQDANGTFYGGDKGLGLRNPAEIDWGSQLRYAATGPLGSMRSTHIMAIRISWDSSLCARICQYVPHRAPSEINSLIRYLSLTSG